MPTSTSAVHEGQRWSLKMLEGHRPGKAQPFFLDTSAEPDHCSEAWASFWIFPANTKQCVVFTFLPKKEKHRKPQNSTWRTCLAKELSVLSREGEGLDRMQRSPFSRGGSRPHDRQGALCFRVASHLPHPPSHWGCIFDHKTRPLLDPVGFLSQLCFLERSKRKLIFHYCFSKYPKRSFLLFSICITLCSIWNLVIMMLPR